MEPDYPTTYDDGSSTESERFDEEILDATERVDSNCRGVTTEVKEELVAALPVTTKDTSATTLTTRKPKATLNKCKRCRRKLPHVAEEERMEMQQGSANAKRCACCGELYPLCDFGLASRSPTRVIPRCRSCSQAPMKILTTLRNLPDYADAVALELQVRKAERLEKRATKPPFERKTTKQRYEEQFQLVGGKTARERRLARREGKKTGQRRRTRRK